MYIIVVENGELGQLTNRKRCFCISMALLCIEESKLRMREYDNDTEFVQNM
jgi:hypothetical protein